MNFLRKSISVLLLLILFVGSLAGCSTKENRTYEKIADLEHARIGLLTSSTWDIVAQRDFPNAERKYFSSPADALLALEQGKIDTHFTDMTIYVASAWENKTLSYIDEPLGTIKNALFFPKEGYNEALLAQVNEFVAKCREDGTFTSLSNKWFSASEPTSHPDYESLTGENGTLKIAVCDSTKPSSYRKGDRFTGYELDFITLFAKEYGYGIEVSGMALEPLIQAVSLGRYDFGACGLTVTPERAEAVTFSDSHFETYGVAVVRHPSANTNADEITSIEDLGGKALGVMTGTLWDGVAKNEIPDAEIKHFSATADVLLALEQGKVSGIVGPATFYVTARWMNAPVRILQHTEASLMSGFMLPKENYDEELLADLNEFIATAKSDGTVEALTKKWMSDQEPTSHPDYTSLSGENGTIKIAVDNAAKPMVYRKNTLFTGFDVDLLTEFAKAYGYALEFVGMSFDALIPYVSEGKCDMGACGIGITPERAEAVTFTDSYVDISGVVMVSEDGAFAEKGSFFDKILTSFEKTFIREDRWRLILEGVIVTLIISVGSAIGGTAIGLGLYMLSRSKTKAVRTVSQGVAKVYSRIIAGTPVVVVLMILFYVVFGSVRNVSGALVASIGFSLTFGSFVYDHMRVSVGSVDLGQTEAAYALGYTKNRAFFRIVFPQAMKIFMPSYCNQAVELIKATAVVGYIAVNDLTKMGDIIRSNTYEAFFPLIATAVIYFFLTWGFSLLMKLIRRRFEPSRRNGNKILKGVKTK